MHEITSKINNNVQDTNEILRQQYKYLLCERPKYYQKNV